MDEHTEQKIVLHLLDFLEKDPGNILEFPQAEVPLTLLQGVFRPGGECRWGHEDNLGWRLAKQAKRCVWVQTLDLDLVPDSINYLLSILVRVQKAYLEKTTRDSGQCRGRPALTPAPHASEVFRRFISDAAMSWDGNLKQRAGHLDSESYAHEAMRIEQARMRIYEFAGVLETLAHDIGECNRRYEDPVFLLPILETEPNPTRWQKVEKILKLVAVGRMKVLILN